MEVIATQNHLKGGFRRHGAVAQLGKDNAHYLLYFYANECGLKYLYLKENHLSGTDKLEASFLSRGLGTQKYGYGHDLLRWIGALKIPGFAFSYRDKAVYPCRLALTHEALRYGFSIHKDQKDALEALFTKLQTQIR